MTEQDRETENDMTRGMLTLLISVAVLGSGAWFASEAFCIGKQGIRCAVRSFWGQLLSVSAEAATPRLAREETEIVDEPGDVQKTFQFVIDWDREPGSRIRVVPVLVDVDTQIESKVSAGPDGPCRWSSFSSQSAKAL